jgi:hypothetical protein
VDDGGKEVFESDGDRIYGVRTAIWTNVDVGSNSNYEFGVSETGGRRRKGSVVVGRICGRECDVESVLCDSLQKTICDCGKSIVAQGKATWGRSGVRESIGSRWKRGSNTVLSILLCER